MQLHHRVAGVYHRLQIPPQRHRIARHINHLPRRNHSKQSTYLRPHPSPRRIHHHQLRPLPLENRPPQKLHRSRRNRPLPLTFERLTQIPASRLHRHHLRKIFSQHPRKQPHPRIQVPSHQPFTPTRHQPHQLIHQPPVHLKKTPPPHPILIPNCLIIQTFRPPTHPRPHLPSRPHHNHTSPTQLRNQPLHLQTHSLKSLTRLPRTKQHHLQPALIRRSKKLHLHRRLNPPRCKNIRHPNLEQRLCRPPEQRSRNRTHPHRQKLRRT